VNLVVFGVVGRLLTEPRPRMHDAALSVYDASAG
jgi:hypothetical protein